MSDTSGIYGNPIEAASLANTQLIGARKYDELVMFPQSGDITTVRKFLVGGSGYSAGTGGSLQYSLVADDGSAAHLPTGTVLGQSETVSAADAADSNMMPNAQFTAPVHVEANTWYHLIAVNTDPNPSANYTSIDDLWNGTGGDSRSYPAGQPDRSPGLADPQFAVRYSDGGGGWTNRGGFTGIADFTYADGSHFGNGYMEASSTGQGGAQGHLVSGSSKVGEVFTVSGSDRSVSDLHVAAVRSSGSAPLTATLTSDGNVVASATSDLIPQGSDASDQHFATFDLSTTLKAGTTYQLELSAPSDTSYSVHAVRDGNALGEGWAASTVFSDGYANYNTGSGWTSGWDSWGSAPTDKSQDLSFYFASSGGPTVSVSPAAAALASTTVTPDTLSLGLSEDSFQGDAQFVVKLDGKQIGGSNSVTASQASGSTDTFQYSGNWGPGPHDLEIDFTNDLYAGPGQDRNLYVDSISYNGANQVNDSQPLYWTGAADFIIGG